MKRHQFVNVSNLAVFAVQWTAESGNEYQLTNPRETMWLTLSCRPIGRDRWANAPVMDLSRLGMTKPPASFAAFRKVADEFVNGDRDGDQDAGRQQ